MSLAVSIYFTSPIITAILCYFTLDEKLNKLEVLSIFSAMLGVIILTGNCNDLSLSKLNTSYFTHLGVIFALVGSLSNAFVFKTCRVIGT